MTETVRDTWAWLKDIPEDRRSFATSRLSHGIAPERETAILTAWDTRS